MADLHADDGYLDRYQFEHDPFLGRGPSFKFFSAKRRAVLIELHHLARYSKLMLVVTGPEGSGKTVLRQALVASSKEPIKSIVVTASANADAASMLQQVNAALGLHDSEIADVLRHIEQLLMTGQEVHVIVDNAECLDQSGLLFLQRIAQGVNDACARVFVFSDSSICPLLEKVADNADLHHVIALEPWDEDEVFEYLEQRLVAAGQALDVFTEQQLSDIYAQSQGWPGQVNDVAKAILLEQSNRKKSAKKIPVNLPYKHLAALAVLAIALVFVWLMQASEPTNSHEQINLPVVSETESQPPAAVKLSEVGTTRVELPLELNHEPVVRAPLAQAVNTEDEDSALVSAEPVPDVAMLPAPRSTASVPVPVPVSTPPADAIKETVAPPVVLAEKKPTPSVRVAPPPPAVKPIAVKKPVARGLKGTSGHQQWYKQQASARYTLQVLGTRTEATAQTFIKQNTAQYHYFRKEHQGQALFVVTYGSFADRAAAQAAINSLPEKVRNDKPWPRTILSIQQELR
jgi:DamX protein